MIDWYKSIKSFYENGAWNKAQVWDAISMGKITQTQYTEITGEPYSTERP